MFYHICVLIYIYNICVLTSKTLLLYHFNKKWLIYYLTIVRNCEGVIKTLDYFMWFWLTENFAGWYNQSYVIGHSPSLNNISIYHKFNNFPHLVQRLSLLSFDW